MHDLNAFDFQRPNFKSVACDGKAKDEWIEGELVPRVKYLLRFNQPPDFLVIHCGGNSNGAV
jgi:hypothetical protein